LPVKHLISVPPFEGLLLLYPIFGASEGEGPTRKEAQVRLYVPSSAWSALSIVERPCNSNDRAVFLQAAVGYWHHSQVRGDVAALLRLMLSSFDDHGPNDWNGVAKLCHILYVGKVVLCLCLGEGLAFKTLVYALKRVLVL
jgi:hypothetical protein